MEALGEAEALVEACQVPGREGKSMGNPWEIYGKSMGNPWDVDFLWKNLWEMENLWNEMLNIYGTVWKVYGKLMKHLGKRRGEILYLDP